MDLTATANHPAQASQHAPPVAAQPDRAVYFVRRFAAWVVDGFVLTIPILAVGFAAILASSLLFGASFGLIAAGAQTGEAGFFGGAAAGILASILAFLSVGLVMLAVPLGYVLWAAHRSGTHAGQTLGQQLLDLQIVRVHDPERRMSARRMIWRAFLMYAVWIFAWIVPIVVTAVTNSGTIGTLTWLVLVGVVLWRAVDGRLPHDRLSATRMADRAGGPGFRDGAR